MTTPSISVCISAYTLDRWDELVQAVDSVKRQTFAAREIIVVVDHNQDLLERAREHLSDDVIIIENTEPAGLSGARNSGVRVARGDVVAFIDDDAVAADNWLEILAEGYRNPSVLGVGGAIDPLWENGRPGWFPVEFNWVVGCTYRGMPESPTPVRNLIGCNMSFRTEVIRELGGFRTGIGRVGTVPVGCEETEFSIRVRQRWPEGVLLYDPRARVQHVVPATRSGWNYFRSRCHAEGISKALIAGHVGGGDALSNERRYTMRTLPSGVGRGFADVLARGDLAGPARAGSIVAGLFITTVGYIRGSARSRFAPSARGTGHGASQVSSRVTEPGATAKPRENVEIGVSD